MAPRPADQAPGGLFVPGATSCPPGAVASGGRWFYRSSPGRGAEVSRLLRVGPQRPPKELH